MKILIAEDDRVSAMILSKALERLGHDVVAAKNGAVAWEMVQTGRYPVLISDWMMPEMDGVDLCRLVRARQADTYVYVILLTAKGGADDRQLGMEAGADDFLVKPLDPSELADRLRVAERILNMQSSLQHQTMQLREQNDRIAITLDYVALANHRFEELFDGLPCACYSYDEDGAICDWNRVATESFLYQAHEVITKHVWDVFKMTGEEQERNVRMRQETVRRIFSGEHQVGVEVEVPKADGSTVHMLSNTFPMRKPDGTITGALTAMIDITHRKELEQRLDEKLGELEVANSRLAELVTTDGLTGLKNHRAFQNCLETEFETAHRWSKPLSLVLFDVDHFKMFNDTFGHPAGDEVLKRVAEIMGENCRQGDVAARYGGEEFALILPNADSGAAIAIAERLRGAIEAGPWTHRLVTASVGVSTLNRGTESRARLIFEADSALYSSKKSGRNCVSHFEDLPAEDEEADKKNTQAA